MLGDLFHHIETLSTSNWFYLIIFVIAFLDSMIPVVPSETMVILGGVAAGQGDLVLPLVILCGARRLVTAELRASRKQAAAPERHGIPMHSPAPSTVSR